MTMIGLGTVLEPATSGVLNLAEGKSENRDGVGVGIGHSAVHGACPYGSVPWSLPFPR